MNQMLQKHFLSQVDVEDLLKEYGSPLYVYDENAQGEGKRDGEPAAISLVRSQLLHKG